IESCARLQVPPLAQGLHRCEAGSLARHHAKEFRMSHTVHTIRLHRVLKAPPQRVYQAFTTAAALAKWLPPHGYICEVPEFDARVGGRYRMAFVNLSTGGRSGFGGGVPGPGPGRLGRPTDRLGGPPTPRGMVTPHPPPAGVCRPENG